MQGLMKQGRHLNRTTVEGQLQKAMDRLGRANYYCLYKAALKDADKGVKLHFSDAELLPGADVKEVKSSNRRRIETWWRQGKTWSALIQCFGPGILLLVPPEEKEET